MTRVNVGKRIFQDPVTQVFKTISVFSEIEPEPEVNQIREYRPNLAEILAAAAAEQVAPTVEVVTLPPVPVEPPVKPKRIWKPRPNRKKGAAKP